MMQPLKQQVIVESDGRIVIHVPQLKPGTHAEVTIVEQTDPGESGASKGASLSSLIGSCCGMFATPEEADAFLTLEREAWDR
jgi:hypothetical protein